MEPEVAASLSRLSACGTMLALKVYRVQLGGEAPRLPLLPCLDHEAMLHQRVAPHLSAYLARDTGDIHEVAIYPSERRVVVDVVSTIGEHSDSSHETLLNVLRQQFSGYDIAIKRPSWWRGDRRVAEACRAQITLHDVLRSEASPDLTRRIDRLRLVGGLMEKESRVASWGVRTATGPLLAAAGVILYAVLGAVAPLAGVTRITELQYALIGVLGGVFLYYGLKAVQLTGMSNRVWKRASEYALILSERQRLGL